MTRAHVRADRSLLEACFPQALGYPVQQINYIAVSEEGQDCPPHRHRDLQETFVCLEGEMAIERHGVWVDMAPGDLVHINVDVWHALRAKPGARYMELRSRIFDPEKPDKEYQDDDGRERIEALNAAVQA